MRRDLGLTLRKRKLPHPLRRNSSSVFDPAHDRIKVMTLHVSKGLEFPVVALVCAGRMPAEGEDEREEARLFYVGATRATQRLVMGASGGGKFARAHRGLAISASDALPTSGSHCAKRVGHSLRGHDQILLMLR